jgi:TATA-box binding protein (TBP) (component of TFIID and TFIIIB)
MSCLRRGERTDLLAIRPCRADAFEVVPRRETVLDLDVCERALRESGYEIVSNPGIMLVVRKEVEMTLYRHGRVLIHPVGSEHDARRIAQALYAALGLRVIVWSPTD